MVTPAATTSSQVTQTNMSCMLPCNATKCYSKYSVTILFVCLITSAANILFSGTQTISTSTHADYVVKNHTKIEITAVDLTKKLILYMHVGPPKTATSSK